VTPRLNNWIKGGQNSAAAAAATYPCLEKDGWIQCPAYLQPPVAQLKGFWPLLCEYVCVCVCVCVFVCDGRVAICNGVSPFLIRVSQASVAQQRGTLLLAYSVVKGAQSVVQHCTGHCHERVLLEYLPKLCNWSEGVGAYFV